MLVKNIDHQKTLTSIVLTMNRSEDIVLPPKMIILRKDAFDPFELDYYQSLYSQSQVGRLFSS